AIQFDGKIVAAGYSNAHGNYDFALARYNADGTLDTTFGSTTLGSTGKVLTDFGGSFAIALASALATQHDGKNVAAGCSAAREGNYDFALARYNPDGTLDTTFGSTTRGFTGKVLTDFSGGYDTSFAMAIQSDGKIVAAGASSPDFALARYLP